MEIVETVTLKKEHLLKAFQEASDSEKTLLKKLYPSHFVPVKITDRVKTFEDACEVLGIDYDEDELQNHTPDELANRKIKIIVKALNEGWTPDWNNSNQYKWYPWFYLNKPGFRFDAAVSAWAYTSSLGGSRLCLKSKELAEYAANQFLGIYEEFIA